MEAKHPFHIFAPPQKEEEPSLAVVNDLRHPRPILLSPLPTRPPPLGSSAAGLFLNGAEEEGRDGPRFLLLFPSTVCQETMAATDANRPLSSLS